MRIEIPVIMSAYIITPCCFSDGLLLTNSFTVSFHAMAAINVSAPRMNVTVIDTDFLRNATILYVCLIYKKKFRLMGKSYSRLWRVRSDNNKKRSQMLKTARNHVFFYDRVATWDFIINFRNVDDGSLPPPYASCCDKNISLRNI
jgi:hypothetical protein